jgi:hypothetical protein
MFVMLAAHARLFAVTLISAQTLFELTSPVKLLYFNQILTGLTISIGYTSRHHLSKLSREHPRQS